MVQKSRACILFKLKTLVGLPVEVLRSSDIICIPKRNRNNEFILCERRWSISKRGGLEIGLEFEHNGFA